MTAAIPSGLQAQQPGYFQTNLVSNTAGVATTTDPQLLNPWGISILPGQDFWIANNNSGTSTLYDANGNKDTALVVTIPGATKNPNGNCNPGCPTGNVANGNGTSFGGGQFIFDTEDGLVTIWTGASNTAIVAFDNSASGAVYKGLALLNGTSLLAANFNSGKIDVLNSNFQLTPLSGSLIDPKLPAGFAPHGIHVINNQIYVAYAMQDAAKHDAMPGAGLGQVDIFDMNGNFVSTFVAAGSQLNAPWGIVASPATFGNFPNAILVGNFGDGMINAFDTTGKFLGQITDSSNAALVNPGLWDMVFGGGGPSGDPGTLYLTAGGGNQPNFPAGGSTTSVFASLVPAAAVTPGFSLSLSPQSVRFSRRFDQPYGKRRRRWRIQWSDISFVYCARWFDMFAEPSSDFARFKRVVLYLNSLCRCDRTSRRLWSGGATAGSWIVRYPVHHSEEEIPYTPEDPGDEHIGFAASRHNICPRMR